MANERSSSGGRHSSSRGGRRPQGRSYRRGRYQSRRKVCMYCADKEKVINWKNTDDMRRLIGDNGSIFPRRKTGMCAKHQRRVAVAIKRARHIAILPFTGEQVRIMSGGR